MASPITWQNINGPDLSQASRPLELAQRSFNGAFDQLGAMIGQRERIGEANWQNTKTNNTQAFLDRVAQFKTPEELAAAQKSGVLDQLRAQFGAQVDGNAIRGAADARGAQLMQQATAMNAFTDQRDERAARPLIDQFQTLMARGDMAGANAVLDGNVLPNEGKLALALREMGRKTTVEGQEDKRFGREGERHLADLADQKARQEIARGQLAVSQGSLGIQRSELGLRQGEAEERRQEKISKQITDTALARSKLKGDADLNTPEGQETMAKYIRDNYKDPNTAASLLAKANKLAQTGFQKDGKAVPVSVGAMLQAIGATEDTRWGVTKFLNDSDQADYVQENLEKVLRSDAYQQGIATSGGRTKALDEELERLKAKLKRSK